MEELIKRYPILEESKESIKKMLDLMYETYKNGGKILLCGNGGSCADCDHIAGELLKGFLSKRKMNEADTAKFKNVTDDYMNYADKLQYGIPAVSLTSHSGVLSAFANDVDPELVYAQLVWALADEKDLLIGLSTSGNSKNVIAAMVAAKAKNIRVAGLCGKKACKMDEYADVVVHAGEEETYKIQELHLPIYHYLCAELERMAFGTDC